MGGHGRRIYTRDYDNHIVIFDQTGGLRSAILLLNRVSHQQMNIAIADSKTDNLVKLLLDFLETTPTKFLRGVLAILRAYTQYPNPEECPSSKDSRCLTLKANFSGAHIRASIKGPQYRP